MQLVKNYTQYVERNDSVNESQSESNTQQDFYIPLEVTTKELFSQIKKRTFVNEKVPIFSSKKVREILGSLFFGGKEISEDRWTAIRSLSNIYLKILNGTMKEFAYSPDKSKHYDNDQLIAVFATTIYFSLRYRDRFPRISKNVYLKFKSWFETEFPQINKLWVSIPAVSQSEFQNELNKICPWFSLNSLNDSKLKDVKISYDNLRKLLAMSFKGYVPSPQYLGRLGYTRPQSRNYSLKDFKAIRDVIIESHNRRGRRFDYIIFDNFGF